MNRGDPDHLGVSEILGEASAVIGAHALAFIVATALYVVFSVWIDDQDGSWSAQVLILTAPVILQALLQYLLFRKVFAEIGGGWTGRVRAPFVVIALQLGMWTIVGFGYVLLLLPGLYLAARMSAALGMAAVEHSGLFGSIGESWNRTRRSAWPLVMVHAMLLVPILALLVGMLGFAFSTQGMTYESIEFKVVTNLVFGVVTMAAWAVAVAVYRLTVPPGREDEDIFG